VGSANRAGFRYFTDVEGFKRYVEAEVLGLEVQAASTAGGAGGTDVGGTGGGTAEG
jgi:hypothetical protein